MDDLDASCLQLRHVLFGAPAGRFADLHAGLGDRLDIFGIRRGLEGREEGEVDAQRLIREVLSLGDFPGQIFRGLLRQPGYDTEPSRLRYRRGKLCKSHEMHSPWMMGCSMPKRSVILVRIRAPSFRI